jgi:hypothetical protein
MDINLENQSPIDFIWRLSSDEIDWWEKTIKSFRSKIIKESPEYINKAALDIGLSTDMLSSDINGVIFNLRSKIYDLYLIDESIFHINVVSFLTKTRNLPKSIMEAVLLPIVSHKEFPNLSIDDLTEKLSEVAGQYVGRIFPYLYQLSLSTTQSRRSRAGSEFEFILKKIFDMLGYSCDIQSQIGSTIFNEANLGKSVDMLVPNIEGYRTDPQECAVITAKTTLRERWTQVAEELQRTNIPRIYLVTLDKNITKDVVERMRRYKITLVVPDHLKDSSFSSDKQVHGFQNFFFRDIPHILSYWSMQEE